MENYLNAPEQLPVKPIRPTFLTVLCILTFLGSGLSIINGLFGYLTADTTASLYQANIEDTKDEIENSGKPPGSALAKKIADGASEIIKSENLKKNALFGVISSIFTLVGAILMFRLKKTGFWIYVLGTVISIAAPIAIYGVGNIVSLGIVFIAALTGIVFVVLYAMNLKYLR
ncbi:MAG: hypothetical protein QM763_02140 [Agriterribacter sp.]